MYEEYKIHLYEVSGQAMVGDTKNLYVECESHPWLGVFTLHAQNIKFARNRQRSIFNQNN